MLYSTFDHVYSQIFSKKMGAHFFSCVEGPNDVESQNLQWKKIKELEEKNEELYEKNEMMTSKTSERDWKLEKEDS